MPDTDQEHYAGAAQCPHPGSTASIRRRHGHLAAPCGKAGTSSPIASAPARFGKEFGPVLLAPGMDAGWTVGRWTGLEWVDDVGNIIKPTVWAPLPPRLEHGPPRASGDAEVLTLFRQWQRQLAIGNERAAPESETQRISELENEIFDTPCGELGDAIKIYLLAQNVLYTGPDGMIYSPAEPGVNGYGCDGRLNLPYSGFRALLRNAARRVPELAPLVIEVLIAPSENPD